VVLASDEATLPVSIAGTVAENLTQVGGSAVSLGAKTSALSIPVVLASDEANVPVLGAISAFASTTITSATSTGLVLSIPCLGYSTVLVDLRSLNTCTGGTIQFEGVGPGNFNSSVMGMRQIDANSQQFYEATSTQSLALSNDTRIIYQIPVAGLSTVNVILSPAFTGSGSILLAGRASNGSAPGPTTVGQSDASKLNVTNQAPVTTNPPVYTTGTTNPLSLDVNGGLRTVGTVTPVSSATWTSATAAGTHVDINCAGMGSVVAIISTTGGTFSTGQIRFFAESSGGFGFDTVGMRMRTQGGVFTQQYDADHTLTLLTNDAYSYWFPVSGFTVFRVYLNTAITGSGQVSISLQAAPSTITGPTTVGQSDASKLNASVVGAVTTNNIFTWNSATALFSSVTIPCAGYTALALRITTDAGTFTTGQVSFNVSTQASGSRALNITGMRQQNLVEQFYDAKSTHNFAPSQDWNYVFNVSGFAAFQIFLLTAITGSGNATFTVELISDAVPAAPTTVGQSDSSKHRVAAYGDPGSFTTKINTSSSGNNAVLTVPAGKKWILKGGYLKLVTGATAGNRIPVLAALDASATFYAQTFPMASTTAAVTQAASTTVFYFFSPSSTFYQTAPIAALSTMLFAFPEVVLGPSFTLQSLINGIVAGDTVQLMINVIELPD